MAIREIDLGIVRGPQGVKGDQGPQGIQGVQGVQGPKGDPGITPPAASKAEAQAGTENTKYMTSKRVRESLEGLDLTPVGDIAYRPYLKAGYVKANGATVNRADYPRLVAFANANNLWTDSPSTEPWKYGRGNGSTTMVLPDYRNRFIQGGDTNGIKQAGLPNIVGSGPRVDGYYDTVEKTGAFYAEDLNGNRRNTAVGISSEPVIKFDASRYDKIYGSSNTVQPPSIVLIPQIRF